MGSNPPAGETLAPLVQEPGSGASHFASIFPSGQRIMPPFAMLRIQIAFAL
jgi:hypothetical protein